MVKVITYGTYDLLHYGHISLLKRAKALGDYLIVGITGEDFDKTRGKINVQESLMERIEAVRETGIADKIIVEEYEGQKIDDIRKYDIDIFTVGSDWVGYFDYLSEYCKVIYLPRTEGVSSSKIREKRRKIKLGMVGDSWFLNKVEKEASLVNGLQVTSICTSKSENFLKRYEYFISNNFDNILETIDAIYIKSIPENHFEQIKKALMKGKHVLCEAPLVLEKEQCKKLFMLAESRNLILMEAIKTAYATAFSRLLLLVKGGKIGEVISVDATCTSLKTKTYTDWNGVYEWGPTALLPILEILGTKYKSYKTIVHFNEFNKGIFAKIDFIYDHAVGSIKIGDGAKSEGELIISGTEGYIYVPSPWWKTDYFELRYEEQEKNRRYFYQLDGEGIRYELVAFVKSIENGSLLPNIDKNVTIAISEIIGDFAKRKNLIII